MWSLLWHVLSPLHEPNMVRVWLQFLETDICDVHSCSLLFVVALDELQLFIWSLRWIEWGNFRCKPPRFFIFGSTILSCVKPGRLWSKSISQYGNLGMYMGYVFIEGLIGWKQWLLLWGTCQCLPTTCLFACIEVHGALHTGFCDKFASSKVGCHCVTASQSMRSQQAGNNNLLVL